MSRRPGIGSNYLITHGRWHKAALRNYTQVQGVITRLPRYYKDKLFNAHQRELMRVMGLQAGEEAYEDAIQELIPFHDDPYAYYDERMRHAHDKVVSKVSKLF